MQKLSTVVLLLAFSLMPLTVSAWISSFPAYDQQDLEGSWDVLVCSETACFGDHCLSCSQLIIGPDGIVADTGAFISTLCGDWSITGGLLTLGEDCTITGTLETSNGTLYVETGAIIGNELCLKASEQ